MLDQRIRTAIHEAGHAVVHVRLKIDHDGAHIVPDEEQGLFGAARGIGAQGVWSEDEAGDMVLAYCAGYAALAAVGHPDDIALAGTGDDFEQAQELLSFWLLPGSLDDWKARATEFMRRPENVAAVQLVAQHLLERGRLDGDFVEVLVEVADGDTSEDDFRRYLLMRGL